MTHSHFQALRLLLPLTAVSCLGLLGGCNVAQPAQDDPTRYFVLSDPAGDVASGPVAAGGARIGLKTVRVESYLKRREIVVRTGANEVQFRDYRRWAEPLDAAITRVLKAKLVGSPGVAQVYSEPFLVDQERDYDVSVEVRKCEGMESRSGRYAASFTALVEVSTSGPNPKVVARKLFVAPEAAWDGSNFDQLANLLTGDVSALGQEILGEVAARN